MVKKFKTLFYVLILVFSLAGCGDNGGSDGGNININNTHAIIIIENQCTKILKSVKVGFSTFNIYLGVYKTSREYLLPVIGIETKKIYSEWQGFDSIYIKSYSFTAGKSYKLIYHATPYAPSYGPIVLKNVTCSVSEQ